MNVCMKNKNEIGVEVSVIQYILFAGGKPHKHIPTNTHAQCITS